MHFPPALKGAFFLLSLYSCLVLSAKAQSDVANTPEEVFLGEILFPQEAGEFQVTVSPQVGGFGEALLSSLGLELGLTDAWQIEAGWSARPFSEAAGHEFELGSQLSWVEMGGGPIHGAIGLEAEWEGSDFESLAPYAILATEVGTAHVFLQGTATLRTGTDGDEEPLETPEDARWAALGGITWPAGPVFLTTEASWRIREGNQHLTAAPGIVAPLANSWQVGIGVPVTTIQGRMSVGMSAFLTYEFEMGAD